MLAFLGYQFPRLQEVFVPLVLSSQIQSWGSSPVELRCFSIWALLVTSGKKCLCYLVTLSWVKQCSCWSWLHIVRSVTWRKLVVRVSKGPEQSIHHHRSCCSRCLVLCISCLLPLICGSIVFIRREEARKSALRSGIPSNAKLIDFLDRLLK